MKRVDWDGSLSLGITLLDEQHRAWIDTLNRLAEAVAANQETAQISETLNFMAGYSEFHFAAEEELMAAHAYPDLEQHKQAHQKFRETLAELLVSQIGQADATRKMSEAVCRFQASWLINHIKTADRGFADFLDQNVSGDLPEGV